ncbi:MAG: autotransporter-associated beta strand repeat-containing protein, partial [Thermoguttaceae bacterium]
MRRHSSRGWVVGLLVLVGVGFLTAMPAHAQTTIYTWLTSPSDWDWDASSLDWTTGGPNTSWSSSTTASQAVFNSPGQTVTVSSGILADAITIDSGATGYIFNSGGITLGSGGITDYASATLNTPVTLGANNQTWTIAPSQTLTIGGVISDGGNNYGLTLTGGGSVSLTAGNTYTGGTTVAGGTLTLSGGSGAIASTAIVVGPGATFYLNNNTGADSTSRTAATVPVTLNGGTFSYLGHLTLSGTETEHFGPLTLGPGQSTVTVSGGGSSGTDHAQIVFGSSTALGSDLLYTAMSGAMVNFTSTIQGQGGPGGAYYSSAAGQTAGPSDNIMFGGPVTNGASSIYGPAAWIVVNGYDFARFSGSNGIHEQDAGTNGTPVATIVNSINTAQAGGYIILTSNTNANCTASETINTLTVHSGTAITSTLTNCKITIANTSVGGGTALDSNGGICVSGSAPFTPSGGYTLTGGTITAGVANSNAELLVWIDSNTTTINSAIQDNGSGKILLSKNGSGTLALTGANTYSYGTDINAGVLNFASGSLPLNNITFYGGTLQWAANNTQDVSAGIAAIPSGQAAMIDTNGNAVSFGTGLSGSGGLVKLGANTLTLAATSTYTGGTTVSVGTLQLGNGTSANGAVQGTITDNSVLAVAPYQPQTVANAMTGSGVLTVAGPAAVSLTNTANSYSGGTSVTGGSLVLGATSGNVTGSGAISVSGGSLNVTNTASVNSNLSVGSGGVLGGSGTLVLPSGKSLALAGTLAPSFGLAGTNTLTVSGGSVTLNAGATLNYNFGAPGGNDLFQVAGGTLSLLSGANDTINVNSISGSGSYVVLAATGGGTLSDSLHYTNWNVNGNSNYNYYVLNPGDSAVQTSAGPQSGTANEVILYVTPGSPTSVWAGANGPGGNVWSATAGTALAPAGNWGGNAYSDGNNKVVFGDSGGTAGNNTVNITGSVSPISVTFGNSPAVSYTLAGGPITGATTTLSVTGGGSVTLSQTNTYGGTTLVSSGMLGIGPTGSIASAVVTVGAAGTLSVSGSWSGSTSLSDGGVVNVVSGGSISVPAISVAAGGALNVSGSLSGLSGSTALTVNGSATFGNSSQALPGLAGTGTVTLASGTNLTPASLAGFTGTVTGGGGMLFNSGATVAVPATATLNYTGGTTVSNGGTLQVSGNNKLGSVTVNSSTLEALGGFAFATSAAITMSGTNPTLLVDSGGTVTLDTAMPAGAAWIKGGAGTLAFSGAATMPSGVSFTATGGGVVDLGGNEHWPSQVIVGGSGGSTIQNGWLNASGGYYLNGNATISAYLIGSANLLASGGANVLSGVNTYSGSTTVSGGTLTLTGASGAIPNTSGIIVGPGATFYVKDATGGTSINTSRTSTTVPVTLNGGKFSYLGNTSYTGTEPEQFGVLTLGPGQSTVTVSGGGSGGTDHADIYFGSTTGATGLSSDLVYTPMSGAMVNFTSTIQGQGGPGGAYYSGAAGQTAGPADFIMFGGPATAGASSIYGPAAWIVVNGHDFARFSGSNGIHEQDAGTNGNPVATVANNITEAQGTGYVILTSGANASCGANETINTLTVQSASPITSTLTNCEITIANTSVGGGTALDSNGGICVSGSAPFTASGGYTLTGGTITAGSGANAELLVWIDSNTTTINSVI